MREQAKPAAAVRSDNSLTFSSAGYVAREISPKKVKNDTDKMQPILCILCKSKKDLNV